MRFHLMRSDRVLHNALQSKRDLNPLVLVVLMVILWMILHAVTGGSFWGPTFYNTYTLQALAWRDGRLSLWHDYPALELAIYEGQYFVSFPPLPSVILWPLTFLFGADTPDNLLVKLYALAAWLMMYFALKRAGYKPLSACLLAFFLCFSSSLLPLTLNGAVWYHAQVLAFFCMTAAFSLFTLDHITGALLCYALAVAARPFDALYALPLFFSYGHIHARAGFGWKTVLKKLLPGIALGLCVACGLGVYNFLRFHDPLEFGHNYLPEFSFQGGVQFSLSHVAKNLKTFLWGLPFEQGENGLTLRSFGFSFLIACPAITLTVLAFLRDLSRKKISPEKCATVFCMLLHLFFLLFHRTFGGYQFGARYAADVIPYAFFYLLLSKEEKARTVFQTAVYALILLFTCYGISIVHI